MELFFRGKGKNFDSGHVYGCMSGFHDLRSWLRIEVREVSALIEAIGGRVSLAFLNDFYSSSDN